MAFKIAKKSDIDAVYTNTFFNNVGEFTEPSAKDVATILIKYFKPKSVIDIGCGRGVYLSYFKTRNINVFGVDGSKAALHDLKISKNEFAIVDLRNGFKPKVKFDLCICFEVAEHLPTEYSMALVDTLTKSSKVIVFTAAPPGQGGTDHINEQKRSYWINLFWKKGYSYDSKVTSKIKKEMTNKKILWYMPENLFVFQKK